MTHIKMAAAVAVVSGICTLARDGEFAGKDEAVAMIKRAVAFVMQLAPQKTYAITAADYALADARISDAGDVRSKYHIEERLAFAGKREGSPPCA